jgi:S-DNA-T family DNA segregation ATPase FtsK/SpoIIIE
MRFAVTVQGRSSTRHVLVGAGPDTPLGQATAAIADALEEPGTELYDGSRRLDPEALLADAGLLEGANVSFAGTPAVPEEPPPLLELHTVSGLGAGSIHPLPAGRHTVGSAGRSAIPIAGAAPLAAEITVTPDGVVSVLLHDGAELIAVVPPPPAPEPKPQRGEPVVPKPIPPAPEQPPGGGSGAVWWHRDADLVVRDTVLRWTEPAAPDSSVQPTEDGVGLDFNRPPRIVEPVPQRRHRIPHRPIFRGRNPFPMVMVIAPAIMGFTMAYLLHNLLYSTFAFFSPVFAVANWITSRRNGRKKYKRDLAEYYVLKAEKEQMIERAVRDERVLRLNLTSDPAALRLIATGPGSRLWERRRRDPDHLVLRLGTADQPSMHEIEDSDRGGEFNDRVRWTVPSLPVGFALADRGVIGMAGPAERIRPLAGWLLAQIAVLHSPHGVRIAVLTDPDRAADWEWLRWLPHLRSPYAPTLLIGNDAETVGHRLSELTGTLTRRQEAAKSPTARAIFADPDLVILVDGARRMRDLPGMMQLFTDGPRMRMFFICVDSELRMLPKEASSVIVDDGELVTLRQDGLPEFAGIRPDLVGPDWFETVARALAPLRDATIDEGSVLPDRLRLTELLDLESPDADLIARLWQSQPTSTVAPIGMGYDGPLAIDLAQDGPHALIAGTTGSGKSELLQTLVASLAVANRPDELTYLLVDYKGGSAFRDCVNLPHTLGMVTDLDGHLVTRVLESLAAELRRRERLLAEYGAKDQPDYLMKRRLERGMPPLPRLLLIVDEFATLVREVPDFIPGMVSLAQRGRSLGIHLVLATQRPAGVVSPDIKANTNLRIALRVLDPNESKDVIDTSDAALIPTNLPGRALVRLSHRSVTAFQAAYSGAPFHTTEQPTTPASAVEVPWLKLGRQEDLPLATPVAAPESEYAETDLSMLVQAMRRAAEDMKIEPQPRPWLPELPEHITLAALHELASSSRTTVVPGEPSPFGAAVEPGGELPPIAIGIEDLPVIQEQRPVMLDLKTFTHLAILGTARSGRTQALRTLAGALAERYATAEVHMYAIDAAGGGLSVLDALPHTGAVVGRGDLERIDRLLTRLAEELTRRQELLAEHHSSNLTELRAAMPPGPRPGHLMLFVDGWESLHATISEHENGRLLDEMHRLLREGTAAGIHVVIAGDRGLSNGRMSNLIEHRVMLRMSDRNEFMVLGMRAQEVPVRVAPGRCWQSGSIAEMQWALLTEDPSGQAQAEALRRIGRNAAQRDAGTLQVNKPFTVGKLPVGIEFAAAFRQLTELKPLVGLLGIGADETGPVTVDFTGRGYAFAVAGPSGSGRSNALATLAISLLASRTKLLVITPRDSPLRRLAADPNVRVLANAQPEAKDIEESLEQLGAPSVVIIDDVDLLVGALALDAPLRNLVRTGRDRGIGLAYAGSAEGLQVPTGWISEARRSRAGVLLQPQSMNEGDVIGGRLPMEIVRRPLKLGRGYVAHQTTGAATAIALPLTELREGGAAE